MALEEILTHFGFSVDNSKLKEADRGVGAIVEKLSGIGGLVKGAAIGFVGKEIFDTIKETIGEVTAELGALRKQAAQLNVTTDFLEQYGYAAKISGVSQEGFSTGLRKLSIGLGNAGDAGAGTGEIFKRLGIDVKDSNGHFKNAGDILPELIDNFSKIPKGAEQSAAAVKLFGRGGIEMIPLLNKGKEAIGELREEFELLHGPVSAQTQADFKAYGRSLKQYETATEGLKIQLVSVVIPALTHGFEFLAKGFGHFRVWAKEIDLFGHVGKVALVGLVGALLSVAPAILSATLALAPWVLGWGLAILAVDDFITFLEGGDSLIGRAIDGWFGDGKAQEIRGWFLDLQASASNFWDDFITGGTQGTNTFSGLFSDLARELSSGFADWVPALATVLAQMDEAFQGFIVSAEAAWNNFVETLHLPDSAKFDLQSAIDRRTEASGRVAAHAREFDNAQSSGDINVFRDKKKETERFVDFRNSIQGKDQISKDGAPVTTLSQGPLKPGTVITHTNYVETNPVINVTVPPGTSPEQARFIARAARDGVRTGARSALGALEPTK